MKGEGKRDRKERKKGKLSEKRERERGKSVRFSLFISLKDM